MNFRLAQKQDAPAVANIHKEEIGKGFLSSLGIGFLSKFYEAVIADKESFCVLCEADGEVAGFATGTASIKKLYGFLIKKYFMAIAAAILPKIFSLSVFKKIIENLFYPEKTAKLPEAELLAIAVKRKFQKRGMGTALLSHFVEQAKGLGIKEFKVLVGEESGAADFYRKNNFDLVAQMSIHKGSESYIFIYKID